MTPNFLNTHSKQWQSSEEDHYNVHVIHLLHNNWRVLHEYYTAPAPVKNPISVCFYRHIIAFIPNQIVIKMLKHRVAFFLTMNIKCLLRWSLIWKLLLTNQIDVTMKMEFLLHSVESYIFSSGTDYWLEPRNLIQPVINFVYK